MIAYSPQVLDHFRHPRHARLLSGAAVQAGESGSRRSGVVVTFQVRVADGRVADAGYQVFGPPYAVAACSLAAERIIGRAATPDAAPPGRELAAALEFPVEQTGVALIVEDAIRAALLSPLPQGEGQGEGMNQHPSSQPSPRGRRSKN